MSKKIFVRGMLWSTVIVSGFFALAGCMENVLRPTEIPVKPIPEKPPAERSVRSGYACCNLHYNADSISDSNLAQLPFIAAGTPMTVTKIEGYRAWVNVDGKSLRMGLDHGRLAETTEQWVNKLVVEEDPRPRIARYSPAVRNAIAKGQLLKGMTREQVIVAVGYPQTDENPRLDVSSWRYWWSSFAPYYVYWSKNGTVSKIDGHAETVAHMTYKGK